ncbi:hypothetical protein [Candidatus Venteria ishoeyi]|uniref:Uncharacterized protein n=1 Tax=Candidatus Venteria ishoeyi TaxID=1899563 RepID=A0A1H6FDS7_9GAMM|nr:hypothetical protein [Candidatus Venteria ishoeyi]MDM8548372.1 hypothetical protein [Candidatus Venteria ishoeyi]SEH08222.1 Uncharacterised protein [Candidatus Venteria ishoeyi]
MATLSIDGIDEKTITQLQIKAKQFNVNINELVIQLISNGLNSKHTTKVPDIHSIFGLLPSSTDGLEFQNTMREE